MPREAATPTIDPDDWGTPVVVGSTPAGDDQEIIDDDEETAATRKLRAALAVAGSDRVRVKLYRFDAKAKGGRVWCADYSPDEFETGGMAMIREQWGAGDYELRIINSQGVAGKSQFTIAAPLVPFPVAGGASNAGNDALRLVLEQQGKILEALSARPDPAAQLMQTFALMKTAREAMGMDSAPAVASVNPMEMFTQVLTMVREAKTTAREIVGDDDKPDSDNPLSMLPQVLDTVKSVVNSQRPQAAEQIAPIEVPASVARVARAQVPAPSSAAPVAQKETSESEPKEIRKLRRTLDMLVSMAECGDEIDDGAEVVYLQCPDELLEHLGTDQWWPLLMQFAPGVEPFHEWFPKVRDRVLAMLADDDAQGDDDSKSTPSPGPASK